VYLDHDGQLPVDAWRILLLYDSLTLVHPLLSRFMPMLARFIPDRWVRRQRLACFEVSNSPNRIVMIPTADLSLYQPTERQRQLIERCKQGDAIAQATLYRNYLKAMQRIAFRITGDWMEAEDVIQEAFMRAFSHLHSFKAEATFGAWLKRIVINTAINHLKRRKAEWVPFDPDKFDVAEDEPRSFSSPWNLTQIQEAIQELPNGYRQVFELYQVEGYDHKEIGDILNISEATSKSQFSRAKRKLRQMLTEVA
jgi:RNA polymerase sigma-70 factor (ECF subfamily)